MTVHSRSLVGAPGLLCAAPVARTAMFLLRRTTLFALSCLSLLVWASQARADLVGHWTFDEGKGTTTANTSGNNYLGNLLAAPGGTAPTWINDGINGNALQFNGTGYVDFTGTNSAFNFGATGFTISGWERTTNPGSGVDLMIADKHLGGSSNGYFISLTSAGNANFFFDNDASRVYSPTAYSDGQWHLVVGTNDGSVGRLYVDGQLIGSHTGVPNTNNQDLLSGGLFLNGGQFVGGFVGSLDDIRVYNNALSQSDVTSLFQARGASPGAVPEPGNLALLVSAFSLGIWQRRRVAARISQKN